MPRGYNENLCDWIINLPGEVFKVAPPASLYVCMYVSMYVCTVPRYLCMDVCLCTEEKDLIKSDRVGLQSKWEAKRSDMEVRLCSSHGSLMACGLQKIERCNWHLRRPRTEGF
jgi:hypothetical protein